MVCSYVWINTQPSWSWSLWPEKCTVMIMIQSPPCKILHAWMGCVFLKLFSSWDLVSCNMIGEDYQPSVSLTLQIQRGCTRSLSRRSVIGLGRRTHGRSNLPWWERRRWMRPGSSETLWNCPWRARSCWKRAEKYRSIFSPLLPLCQVLDRRFLFLC